MAAKRMLILDRGLVERIDDYRGDLTRAEFIELCINSCLEGAHLEIPAREEVEPEEPRLSFRAKERVEDPRVHLRAGEGSIYATREEFLEFKRNVRELLKAFLDFFITFGLELGSGAGAEEMGKFKTQLRTLLKEES